MSDARFTPAYHGGSGPPIVCLHGFTGSWRVWELVLPMLERRHEVLAPTLLGHAGGPPLNGPLCSQAAVADAVERAMDQAGFETAHIVGNSLGGYVALQLAARRRARTVVALAPAGGWAAGDESFRETLAYFNALREQALAGAPYAEQIAARPGGRRLITEMITSNYEHIPAELVADMIRSVAGCSALAPMIELALREGWSVDAERVGCPVRFVWGTDDRILAWPSTAARYREQFPQADWVELDGVGHCPQLDVPLETAELILGFAERS